MATTTIARRTGFGLRAPTLDQVMLAGGIAAIWAHLLDAAMVHPQQNASWIEHSAYATLAVAFLPAAALAGTKASRAWRGAVSLAAGIPALVIGAVIHVAGIVRNDELARSDLTGIGMFAAGIMLTVLGVVLLTLAIPRRRYRALMIPAALLGLIFGIAPFALGVFVTHVPRYKVETTDIGFPYEEVAFETSDGLTLRGWYVHSTNGAAIAVIHGSGGARTRVVPYIQMLAGAGYGVLAFDVRGHGESDGATLATGWGAHPDATAAAAYLKSRPDVEQGRIGLLGVSMGGEIAIEQAAHDDGFAAIVADGPSGRTFGDLQDSGYSLATKLMNFGSAALAEGWSTVLSGQRPPERLTNLAKRVDEPILYIASGTADDEQTIVTAMQDRTAGPSDLWIVEGAGHTEGLARVPEAYAERVLGWFARWLPGPE